MANGEIWVGSKGEAFGRSVIKGSQIRVANTDSLYLLLENAKPTDTLEDLKRDILEVGTTAGGGDMLSTNNLNDVANKSTSRTNLDVYSKTEVDNKDTAIQTQVTANNAKVSANGLVTTHSDVTSAGSGEIITSAERTKLDNIEALAEVNPTDAETKTAYENNADTNAYTDSEKAKLASVDATHYGAPLDTQAQLTALAESTLVDKVRHYVEEVLSDYFYNAQATSGDLAPNDQTGGTGWWMQVNVGGETPASIKSKYESNADTNAFQDAEKTKLSGVEALAEVNQTDSEIKTQYEANADTNAFTDADKTKLDNLVGGTEPDDVTIKKVAVAGGGTPSPAGETTNMINNSFSQSTLAITMNNGSFSDDAVGSRIDAISGAGWDMTFNFNTVGNVDAGTFYFTSTLDVDINFFDGFEVAGTNPTMTKVGTITTAVGLEYIYEVVFIEEDMISFSATGKPSAFYMRFWDSHPITGGGGGYELVAQYENPYTTAEQTKLGGIEALAEVNQTDSEIKTQYENNADTNAFTDADKTKLDNTVSGVAPDDVTIKEIGSVPAIAGLTTTQISTTWGQGLVITFSPTYADDADGSVMKPTDGGGFWSIDFGTANTLVDAGDYYISSDNNVWDSGNPYISLVAGGNVVFDFVDTIVTQFGTEYIYKATLANVQIDGGRFGNVGGFSHVRFWNGDPRVTPSLQAQYENPYTTAEKDKLANIEANATANNTDAYLLNRTNHTGTQTASTISDFDTEVANNTTVAEKVSSDPSGVTGADQITNMMSLTQGEYDAIGTPNATTLYVIV